MGKKLNTEFLAAYIELDAACSELLELKRGGITEYINRLKENKSIPQRDEALSKLGSYRRTRNKLAHEEGALSDIDNIDKADIRWLKDFKKSVTKRKDPISLFNKPTNAFKTRVAIIAAAVAVIAIIIILLIK